MTAKPVAIVALISAATIACLPAQQPAEADMQKKVSGTMHNMRQVGLALFEFDVDFGTFPNAETAKEVKDRTGTPLPLEGTTSNHYLRQLFAAMIISNSKAAEALFQFGNPGKPADNAAAKVENVLAKGKCDFAYFPGVVTSGMPTTPLVIAPLVPGKRAFDPGPLGGKAVVLRVDNSVQTFPITPEGDVLINGKSLFDPEQPFWDGKAPEIAWPE